MGRVYHANYFVWLDMARTEFLRKLGFSYKEMEDQGLFFVVAEAQIKYLGYANFDEEIEIKLFLKEKRKVSLLFGYELVQTATGKCIVEAETLMALVNREGRPVRLPVGMMEILK